MKFTVESPKNKGSITVEASIIIPVTILCIAAVIYMGLLLQQRTAMQSAAESAAEAGALAWAESRDMPGANKPNDFESKGSDLYRRLFDADKEKRLGNIENYARQLAGRHELIKPVETSVTAELKDYVIYKKLVVTINKSYKNPLGGLAGLLGTDETIDMKASAVSTVNEPAELIRTADFVLDIEKKLENKFPDLKNLADKTRSAMNDMKNKLSDFLE